MISFREQSMALESREILLIKFNIYTDYIFRKLIHVASPLIINNDTLRLRYTYISQYRKFERNYSLPVQILEFTVAKNFQPVKYFRNDASSPSHPSFSSISCQPTFEEREKKTNKKGSYSTVTLQTVSRVEKTIHARAILPQVSRVGPGAPYRTSTSRRKVGGRRVSGLTPREIESKGVDGEERREKEEKKEKREKEREKGSSNVSSFEPRSLRGGRKSSPRYVYNVR